MTITKNTNMSQENDIKRFKTLTFNDFKKLAKDKELSPYQKIGFPDSYRQGYEGLIFQDIIDKNPNIKKCNQHILDVGPGCSELIFHIIELCEKQNHQLYLLDSQEMLDLIPDKPFIHKIAGRFPEDCHEFISSNKEKFDSIICYSVFHYIFTEGNVYSFIDNAVSLLNTGSTFFLADIPNISKRMRFFATNAGIKYHQQYTQTQTLPPPFEFNIQHEKIDDGVLYGIINRYRNFGFEAYILPQPDELPMSNRREDILIKKQ